MKSINIIVACTFDIHGIGLNGKLPWNYHVDMNFFKTKTSQTNNSNKINAIIMGRKTWESLPIKPLSGRLNIVISSQNIFEAMTFKNLNSALEFSENESAIENIFIIGGHNIFKEALKRADYIYMTKIMKHYDCDTVFPNYDDFNLISSKDVDDLKFCVYQKHEEYQYINLIKDIIGNGVKKGDRTGIGTVSVFGRTMRFNLEHNFPLLTTKRVFWRGIVEELLWFLKGQTNSKLLSQRGVKIWDGNTSREFLDKVGLTNYQEGDAGPNYSFQWRHFGAEYKDCNTDYTDKGIDQIKEIIYKIKNAPNDRRIILSAWNPCDLSKMALPPCHVLAQFYVNGNELSCQMYQRSADVGLGVPFNIASYSLLTYMIAHITNLKPKEFIHVLGDTHIYNNHIDALNTQINNNPRSFPRLFIDDNIKNIEDFAYESFKLEGYNPYSGINMEMAV